MSERTEVSFDAALMMALRADAQRELDSLPTPKQFEEIYPDTSQWDERMTECRNRKKEKVEDSNYNRSNLISNLKALR